MSNFSRIPFGIRKTDGLVVDVHEVSNGRACDCFCPSCKTPLIARQGSKKEWHFAHATMDTYESTKNSCEYSFFVSVVLMSKQVFTECRSLQVPEYKLRLEGTGTYSRLQYFTERTITPSRIIELDSCQIDAKIDGIKADILARVKDAYLAIYLQHPEKSVIAASNDDFHGLRIGVLGIDLGLIPLVFNQSQCNNSGYKSLLEDFLFKRQQGKRWIYHPRQDKAILSAQTELKSLCEKDDGHKISSQPCVVDPNNGRTLPIPVRNNQHQVQYECVICRIEWTGWSIGENHCPKCGESLYARDKSKNQL
jgi:hypothetical protein